MVANSTHRIGLSWSSLSKALGAPAEPGAWAVLYLGSHKESRPKAASQLVNVLSKTNESIPLTKLKGVVILDGNWKQSKSLWWRNAWLKKLPRLMLFPTSPSLYGTLRREPRKNSVSTLEAAAYVIEAVEPKSALPTYLRGAMGDFVERAKRISVDTAAAPLVH